MSEEITEGSGCVYADLGLEQPQHGEVRRNGDDTYVWDGDLRCWIQTKYAGEQ